ncbi:MAG: hypothetical protein DCC65_06650 [Planctomycetota bacterium]|nr:MAG: hypothetical protein DCC65_06650 [Planctomycetota bacterium]
MPDDQSIGQAASALLAALPAEGDYFSPLKIAVYLLCILLWAHNSAWVQKDTLKIKVPAGMWVALVFGAGAFALVTWLLVPMWWLGLVLFAVIYGSAILIYVFFRNSRVAPGQTVLTIAHIQRIAKGGKSDAGGEELFTKDRVRIKAADGKTPAWPTDADENAAYAALQELVFDAIWRRASDVRVDMAPDQPLKVIYRVDGLDRLREPIDGQHGPRLFAHLKRIAGMNPEEKRRPQSGRFKATIGAGGKGDKSVDVEARTSGSTAGERLALKIVSDESKFRLADIGLTPKQLPKLVELVKEPRGLILVGGPKGSGVTSTLYAMLREHDAFLQNIHSLEMSKDQEVENITQHVFDSQGGELTFGKRARSILRMEPDVCMISDLADVETAQVVATYSKAGKKLYLGVQARDTFSALQKYMQAVGEPATASANLLAVTSQRLVRILCTTCRKGYKPDPAILKKANLPLGENRPFYRPPNPNELEVDKQGNPIICAVCQGSGYYGRTGVFEMLVIDEDLRALLAKGTPLATIKTEARKRGMLYLQEVALHKVYEGQTSINEVLRVTKEEQAPAAPARA